MADEKTDRSFVIDSEIVNIIHGYVIKYPQEICANLKNSGSSTLIPHNIIKGKLEEYSPGKYRGTCSHVEYSSNILHTHPQSSYAYPSTEDILKVIKHHGKIKNSFIGTKWGMWVVSNTPTSNIYSTTQHDKLHKYISQYLDQIGIFTKTSSEEREKNPDKSRELNSEDYLFISKVNKKIEDTLNIKIDLYSWNDIISTGVVIV